MSKRTYAKELTRQELEWSGITEVTKDGHVFRGLVDITPKKPNSHSGYFSLSIYDHDENWNKIKIYRRNSTSYYTYKSKTIGLHRIMWAWFYGKVPAGFVIDHINNRHSELEDYTLDNLQLTTQQHNTTKDKKYILKVEMPRNKILTLEYIDKKLFHYLNKYEEAKAAGDQEACHKLRASISQWRSKRRQFLESEELQRKANSLEAKQKAAKKVKARLYQLKYKLDDCIVLKEAAKANNNLEDWHTYRAKEVKIKEEIRDAKEELRTLK